MTLNDLAYLIAALSVTSSVISIIAVAWSLISGSYKDYIVKRQEHMDQLRKVQDKIRRNQRGIR